MTALKSEPWIQALDSLGPDTFEAVGMSADAYTSQAFLERERRLFFASSWCAVGFAHDVLEPGDVKEVNSPAIR